MTWRAAKVSLVWAAALYYTLIVFNNLTDYDANFQFVRHVVVMDSTFPGNHGIWRALHSSAWSTIFYVSIIAWEAVTMTLCWWGGLRLARAIRENAPSFRRAGGLAVAGLTLGMLLWLVAFLIVGGEWFLMWQSATWNGQEAALRMFAVTGIILLVVAEREPEEPL
jgi:predicted small integral membrane protein